MRSNPTQLIRKFAPGSVSGDRVVQPGVHTVPTAGGVRIAASESPALPCGCAPYSATLAGPFNAGVDDEQSVFDLCSGDITLGVTIDDNWTSGFIQRVTLEVRYVSWNAVAPPFTFSYFAYVYSDGGPATTVTKGLGRDSFLSPFPGPTETSGLAKPLAGDTMELIVADVATGTANLEMKYNGGSMFTASDTPDDVEWASVEVYLDFFGNLTTPTFIEVSDFTIAASCP